MLLCDHLFVTAMLCGAIASFSGPPQLLSLAVCSLVPRFPLHVQRRKVSAPCMQGEAWERCYAVKLGQDLGMRLWGPSLNCLLMLDRARLRGPI